MKEEVERIKKLVGIDHNRWEQPCTCDKCKNMCEVPCIGTPKDIEAIIDAGYADRLKETMWMVGYLAVKEKPIAMIQPTEKDGWCVFRRPDGLCELHDRGLKPTEGVLASCKVVKEDNVPTYETSVLRAVAHEWVMAAKRAEICERYDKKIRQAEAEKKIMLCVFDYGLSTDNVIYYSHTNTLSFNWNGYGEKITQEEFDDFVNKVDRSQLPEGIKFELK